MSTAYLLEDGTMAVDISSTDVISVNCDVHDLFISWGLSQTTRELLTKEEEQRLLSDL